jgi:outer membrane protein TolC
MLPGKEGLMTRTGGSRGGLLPALALAGLALAWPSPCVQAQTTSPPPVAALPAVPAPPPVTASATPPAARRLTLEEAKQLALQNNKALALAVLNVEEKQYATDAARKDYLPKLLGSATYFHFDRPLGQVVSIRTGALGILPAGTVLREVAVANQDSYLGTVFAAQPITRLIAVNAAVQIARADATAAEAQLDKGMRDLLSGVAQAYHALLGARRIEAALQLQIQALEPLAGADPQVRIGLVQARQGLAQVRGQIAELTGQLNNLLDLPACTVLELVDPLPASLPARCADEAAQLALVNNPEVREAEQNVTKATAALKVAWMAYLPDVNVIGGYANQTVTNAVQPNIGYLGITANVTFWEWGKKRDLVRQRQTQIVLAQQNLAVTMDKVQLEARKAHAEFEQARDTYRLAGEMVQARKDAERAATGAAALQAKAETAKAELEQLKADIAYRVAHARLAGAIGQP